MLRVAVFCVCAILISANTPEVPEKVVEPAETVFVEGLVVDHETNEPLPGAKIKVHGHDKAIYADLDGRFRISDMPPGVYSIIASYVSYQSEEITDIALSSPIPNLLITLKP